MTGGTLTSKTFNSFSEAILFSVYQVPFENTHEIYKVGWTWPRQNKSRQAENDQKPAI